jgi:hypothetical protein
VPGLSRPMPCPECRTEEEFVQPPCEDGHGEECPDWLCPVCGTGLVDGTLPRPEPAPASRRPRAA